MPIALLDNIWFDIILERNFSVASEYLVLEEREDPFVLCKPFSLKGSSVSLHHFVFT